MSVESKPNKLVKGLVLDTFHTDVDNTVATYALNAQLEDQEGNHFHYGSEVGTTYIKEIPANHVVVGHINMERNETVLFTTDGGNSTIGILSRNDDMSYHYEIKVDDTKQTKKLGFKKDTYIRGVYRLLNGCDKVIYFVDGINKDRRININQLDSYKIADPQSVASGIVFDDSLRATIFALSSASGNIQLIRLMSASPEATANVLANLSSGAELTKLLTASANGIGTALANLMRTANIISSVEATGTTTTNVDIVRLLQSNVTAIGSVNAILESIQQGVVEIDVTLSGVASSTAILLRAALLESSLTTEASTIVDAILTRIINAQSQATANTSATAQITVPINATATATATTDASALLSYAVNATANAMAETSATAQLSQVINASLNATASSSLEALIGLVLVSTTTATGSISTANLFINRLLASSVTAEGTTTAEALIAKLLDSSVTAQANTTADSLVSKLLESTVDGLSNTTANLQLADLLSLTVSGTATIEALLEAVSTMFSINRGLRFSAARSTYLSRTPSVAGSRTTWTWSGWVKRGKLGTGMSIFDSYSGNVDFTVLNFDTSNKIIIYTTNTSADYSYETVSVFRDTSTWYHIVITLDTSNVNVNDRFYIYVNGVRQSTTSTYGTFPQGTETYINSTVIQTIGRYTDQNMYFDGYMAEVNFIDGQALTPTSFGELNLNLGTWIPKAYTGTYGTNGFKLNFNDVSGITATTLGEDSSVNSNNWTPSGFSVTAGVNYDGMTDSPTNTSETIGNYATLNPLTISNGTLNNGNLNWIPSGNNSSVWSTIAVNTGKWYFEYVYTSGNNMLSISQEPIFNSFSTSDGITKLAINMYSTGSSNNFIYNSVVVQSFPAGWGTTISGDVIGVLIDFTTGIITIRRNNDTTNQVNYTMSSVLYSQPIHFGYSVTTTWSAGNFSWNFGQRPFTYSIPTGFKTLNTFNLPTPTIGVTTDTQANKFMDVSLYSGTGVAQSVFNSGFKPDLVWIKNRTGTAANHAIYDINRGVTKQLSSSTTAAETTEATGLTSFDTTGFTIGALGQINTSGNNYIAWQWRASGTTVANNVGTIPSTVSVNTTSGFSIVRYTGDGISGKTVGHGLGVIPSMIIAKQVTTVGYDWVVWHKNLLDSTYVIYLNTTQAQSVSTNKFNGTLPTSSVITLGNHGTNFSSGANNQILYAWAEIDGFSKFNSYVGNGSADGTFVYTGFRPKFILIKASSTTGNWAMYNSIVNTSNPVINELLANTSAIENTTGTDLDFLSNGFKLRSTNADINTSAATYIYAAFGEFPLKYANAALTEKIKEPISVGYLVVAGGGGGGEGVGGGGGAGGLLTNIGGTLLTLNKGTTYTITVGDGGVVKSSTPNANAVGNNGNPSSIAGTGLTTITAAAGGGGGSYNSVNGNSGGSGGGRGGSDTAVFAVGASASPSGQGNDGGGSGAVGINTSGGGGGGAGTVGSNGLLNATGANGGTGLVSTITGLFYAGGGGGGTRNAGTGGTGGSSIGGNGGGPDFAAGTNGFVNTGSGGGGGAAGQGDGGAGGKGVVLIRSTVLAASTSPTITPTTSGIYYIYTFNGTGSITY
jgi:hypothetical protein